MTTFLGIVLSTFGISLMQLILATAVPFIVAEIGGDALYEERDPRRERLLVGEAQPFYDWYIEPAR